MLQLCDGNSLKGIPEVINHEGHVTWQPLKINHHIWEKNPSKHLLSYFLMCALHFVGLNVIGPPAKMISLFESGAFNANFHPRDKAAERRDTKSSIQNNATLIITQEFLWGYTENYWSQIHTAHFMHTAQLHLHLYLSSVLLMEQLSISLPRSLTQSCLLKQRWVLKQCHN